jgi:hypothetical protein
MSEAESSYGVQSKVLVLTTVLLYLQALRRGHIHACITHQHAMLLRDDDSLADLPPCIRIRTEVLQLYLYLLPELITILRYLPPTSGLLLTPPHSTSTSAIAPPSYCNLSSSACVFITSSPELRSSSSLGDLCSSGVRNESPIIIQESEP